MALSILFGYAGVTVYKMICSEDGHMQVSLMHDDAACHHQKNEKDCCKPVKQQKKTKECCDYNNAYLQLEEISPVHEQQNTTGHFLTAVAILFTPYTIEAHLSATGNNAVAVAPPLILHKQSQQSLTQVFRI
jgi:hypothetical protein